MNKRPDAGYDEPSALEEEDGPVTFKLERFPHQYAISGLHTRLLRNGVPIGMIRVKTEEEFEHLKRRIDSVLRGEGDPKEHKGSS